MTVNIVGQPMEDFAQVCPSCGARQDDKPPVIDNGGFGWGLLGCGCTGGRIGAVSGVEGYKTQDRKSSRNRCAGLGGAGVLYYLFIILSAVTYGVFS